MTALAYRTTQTYRDAFTYQGSGSVAPPPPTPTVTVPQRKPRAGGVPPTIIRRKTKPEVPESPPERSPMPLSLRSQYDALLEHDEISADEWVAILMVHGVSV